MNAFIIIKKQINVILIIIPRNLLNMHTLI